MQEPEPAEQDGDESLAEKRARWEHLRLAPCVGVGKVNVCNVSYGVQAKSDHTYTVSVESGIPFDCTCPNWTYNNPESGCKHMIAVSNAPDVMDEAQPDVATDGGTSDTCDRCGNAEPLGANVGLRDLTFCPKYDSVCSDCIIEHGPDKCDHDEPESNATNDIGTVTGWNTSDNQHYDEDVDTTPL